MILYAIIQQFNWDYSLFCRNSSDSWELIEQHPDKLNDYNLISRNSNLIWDIIKENYETKGNYKEKNLIYCIFISENY